MIPKQFSEKLRFTLSKIKKSALLWNAAKARNTKASGTTWPVKRSLQRSLSGCSPSWQWPLLPSSFLLNLWWESRQEGPILARHPATAESPGSDAWQGAGCFADGAERDVPVHGFLRCFGDLVAAREQLLLAGGGTTTPGCSPPGKLCPGSLCGIPTILGQKSESCLGLHWCNKDRTAD